MPFKSLRPEERSNAVATPLSAAARNFYSDKQSSVYTTASNASIQKDLTRHALELLQIESKPLNEWTAKDDDDVFLLLELGAGSGLSTRAAHYWFKDKKLAVFILALDISAAMLSLASQSQRLEAPASQAWTDFYCGNAAQKLPLRSDVLDGAIGISMLQWLQPKGLEICFSSLFKQLASSHDTRVVFQVYPSNLAYIAMMEQTALRVGFNRAETFVSFPHSTTAKKWFFCVKKRRSVAAMDGQETVERSEMCLFARRYDRRCVLQWLGKKCGNADEIRKRVEMEHVKTAWHIWRKYRRSVTNDKTAATLAQMEIAMQAKAQQSLELYPSDKYIGQALQLQFEARAGRISLAFLLKHAAEVVDVLHTAYTEARKTEVAHEHRDGK
uniref:Methyltransferase type 11 domain-containing protein n=1 Tax=Hyaloperonospora arabidopsidis (strain Emoy2) TaxID=559515 RepID=M4BI41_HYAAE